MSKQPVHNRQNQNKSTKVISKVTQQISLLPSSNEMKGLKEIDPRLVDTYMDFVKNDHQHKIGIANKNMDLANKQVDNQTMQLVNKNAEYNKTISLKKYGLSLMFIIIVISLSLSTFLIYHDFSIAGSLFATPALMGIIGIIGKIILAKE